MSNIRHDYTFGHTGADIVMRLLGNEARLRETGVDGHGKRVKEKDKDYQPEEF